MQEIQLCTGYRLDGRELALPPYDDLERVTPIFERVPGWDTPVGHCRRIQDLPENARRYVQTIENAVGCPIWLVSVGADREQTIELKPAF